MQSLFPFEFNPKIERTFHSRRKKLKLEKQIAKAQEATSTMVGGGGDQGRMLRDFATPRIQGIASNITHSKVEENNFELKPALIFIVQQSHFGGTSLEDPNLHHSVF